ncbi:MAG: exported protein of unknown function [Candidatus Saccharibacteria bacterium]|nr:exported protein of unknown function [Candidatus Saccharibacteria bacterium]
MYTKVFQVNRKLLTFVLSLGIALSCAFFVSNSTPAHAVAGVSQQINFQGRLFNAQGATVPDGNYNIQFKIYQDGDGQTVGNTTGSPAGVLKWTESHLNVNAKGIVVKNGYMSVQLGSVTAFGSSVDWNQDTLWLSMNIANTNATCTPFTSCSPDGEMIPMKRLSSTPFSLNSGLLGGLSSAQFLQLAQGVQTDASTNTSSIFINKTNTGNLLQLQSAGSDALLITNTGNFTFGANADHTLSVATAAASTAGKIMTVTAGAAGTGAGALTGGNLVLQGGAGGGTNGNGGNVAIDAGLKNGAGLDGTISIGSSHASTIQIGNSTLASGTQTVNVGNNNTTGGTTNVVIGAGGAATGGTTTLQAKGNITLATNGTTRATFDNTNSLYLGNGVTAATPNSFTINGTASSTTTVAGGSITIQGGNATVGNANGGSITLSGGAGIGTGANGLIVLTTPTFSTTTNDANCYTGGALVTNSCTIATASVNNSAAILVGFNQLGQTATLPNPTILTAGRIVYLTAANGSSDFTVSVNGGGVGNLISMRQNTSATMIWNGTDWTAAGASSSTTLQSAYDNTLQSAGGAELIVSKTSTTNGFTIRDSSTAPVNGTLLSVQTASAAVLFSVNSNVTEYSSNSGIETPGSGGAATFPASTWSSLGAATTSRYTTAGNFIATGQASAVVVTTTAANDGIKNTLTGALTPNNHYNVSFAARLSGGTFTDMNVYYSVDGIAASVACTTAQAVNTSLWTKVNCAFTAPASGVTSSNAILIRQTGSGTQRTFYVDNLSVAIAADYNYATDGSVVDDINFVTNWSSVSTGTVSRSTTVGNDASDSAQVITTGTGQGVRNKLAINPLPNTLYRVTAYAASATSLNNFTIRYTRNAGASLTSCADYNTQTVSTTLTTFTQITCYITTDSTAATDPYIYFTQTDATPRTFYVDTFSMTLSSNATPNVQIGGGINGGPATLLTLDRGASAPIASNNDALLGSMYYDTSLGKLQCYEADGWGACGSSPDNVVTISPEYTNAVMHGTGVGTMTSDICSDTLNLNDGSSGQSIVCGANETFNFYKWTSPQASAQTYSIFVTYQLPTTFKSFASGQTSIMGRTDSANSSVQYQIYKNDPSTGMTTCGSAVSVASGNVTSWRTGIASGAADPSTCGFGGGNSIVFKISVSASQNANAYVGNLNFTFSNR